MMPEGRDCGPIRQRSDRSYIRIDSVSVGKTPITPHGSNLAIIRLLISGRREGTAIKKDTIQTDCEGLRLRWIRGRRWRKGRTEARRVSGYTANEGSSQRQDLVTALFMSSLAKATTSARQKHRSHIFIFAFKSIVT
jgi:hypothetical protein